MFAGVIVAGRDLTISVQTSVHEILWEQWCDMQSNVFIPPIPSWNSTGGIPPWNKGIWWNSGIGSNSTKEQIFHLEFPAELEFQWNGGIVESGAK